MICIHFSTINLLKLSVSLVTSPWGLSWTTRSLSRLITFTIASFNEIQKAQGQDVSTIKRSGSGVWPFEAINNNDNICNNINKKTIRVNNMPQKTECLRLFSQPSAKCFLKKISVIIASPNGHRGAAIQAALTKAATHTTEAMVSSVSKTKTTLQLRARLRWLTVATTGISTSSSNTLCFSGPVMSAKSTSVSTTRVTWITAGKENNSSSVGTDGIPHPIPCHSWHTWSVSGKYFYIEG